MHHNLWASWPDSVRSYWSGNFRHHWLSFCTLSCNIQLSLGTQWLPGHSLMIWEGEQEGLLAHSQESREISLATSIRIQQHRNVKNQQHQHLMCHIQTYPIMSLGESLTDQLPIILSTWWVSSTETLGRRPIGTCAGRLQKHWILTQLLFRLMSLVTGVWGWIRNITSN